MRSCGVHFTWVNCNCVASAGTSIDGHAIEFNMGVNRNYRYSMLRA